VLGFLREVGTKRRREGRSKPAHVTAQEYCEYLLTGRCNDTSATLGELGLRRSEDVGRVITALVNRGLASRHESDTESDFDGLFVLD
jgi:uncharacterized repeat protein (TIGR04138 family)